MNQHIIYIYVCEYNIYTYIIYTHIYTCIIYTYIYIYMDNKEKEAIDFGKALGGGIRGRALGRVEGRKGKKKSDIILF